MGVGRHDHGEGLGRDIRLPADVIRGMSLTSRALRKRRGNDEIAWRAGQVRKRGSHFIKEATDVARDSQTHARWMAEGCNAFNTPGWWLEELTAWIVRFDELRVEAIDKAKEESSQPEITDAWIALLDDLRTARSIVQKECEHWRRVELSVT